MFRCKNASLIHADADADADAMPTPQLRRGGGARRGQQWRLGALSARADGEEGGERVI